MVLLVPAEAPQRADLCHRRLGTAQVLHADATAVDVPPRRAVRRDRLEAVQHLLVWLVWLVLVLVLVLMLV